MKKIILIIWIILFPSIALAQDSVNFPWQEFKSLFQESVERKLADRKDASPHIYGIDSVQYNMKIETNGCHGELVLKGDSIAGKIGPIPIFKNNMIIKKVREISNGSLLCSQKQTGGISFLPKAEGPFLIKISFFLPVLEDNRSQLVSMDIPSALKNSLTLDLPKHIHLMESPGMPDSSGAYHFAAQQKLMLRFSFKKQGEKNQGETTKDFAKDYKIVKTPPIVLDTISYFTTLEENGTILSTLVMTVPSEAGSHIKIKTIPGADVWSLKVNNKRKKVYTSPGNTGHWLIPLAKDQNSYIELSLIRQVPKMGLHGRLEVFLPGMDLPSRKIFLGVGLPERVDLVSYEGPVTPAAGIKAKAPKEFMGRPYYFSRAFYRGQGMTIAVMYKEPVRQHNQK
ncbi:MAG: hypothetical protein GY729_21875 [Desulfobacteraceae bacterium]|nr:hypothetical protein [Desulfobacteraceae bacterium]